jgi:hypothetical protein
MGRVRLLARPLSSLRKLNMKYEVIKDGVAKDGRSFTSGNVVDLNPDYADHLIARGIIKAQGNNKKSRAVNKPKDLEQATEE